MNRIHLDSPDIEPTDTAAICTTSGIVSVESNSSRTNITGISSTDIMCRNLNGTASTSGATATVTVDFVVDEDDANYLVTSFLPTTSSGGVPAAGANRVLSISKTLEGFVVTLEAAPGGSTTVSFDWSIQR